MNLRLPAALLLSCLLTVASYCQTAKESYCQTTKEPAQDQTKTTDPPKVTWPDKIDDKDVHAWLTLLGDPFSDPAMRAQAVTALSHLSPWDVRKYGHKTLLNKLKRGGELDSSVKLAIIDLVGGLGFEDAAENKEATLYLQQSATDGASVLRLHALVALARFGHKAHDQAAQLTNDNIAADASYDIRHMLAHTLGQIGGDEHKGPNELVLKTLLKLSGAIQNSASIHERCAIVRLEALQSLVRLGPAFDKNAPPPNPKANPPVPVKYDEKSKTFVIDNMKARIGDLKKVTLEKDKEPEKQLALWCRLVIFRFAVDDEKEMATQVKGIANYVSANEDTATRIQALQLLAMVAEFITKDAELAPIITKVTGIVQDDKEAVETDKAKADRANADKLAVRVTAMHTLGAFGEKVAPVVISYVRGDTKEKLAIRVAAIDALAMMGEKGAAGQRELRTIVQKVDLGDNDSFTLLTHAIAALAAMGVKSKDAIGDFEDLKPKVRAEKEKRLKSAAVQELLNNPNVKKFLATLPKEEQDKLLKRDTVEDHFEQTIQEAIQFIRESKEGRPGPEPKTEPKK